MLDIKKLLTKILAKLGDLETDHLYHTSGTYTIPNLSAGAKGYWTITLNPAMPNGAVARGVFTYSGQISATSGLQLTPIYASGSTAYVHYYSPNALLGTNTLALRVLYTLA